MTDTDFSYTEENTFSQSQVTVIILTSDCQYYASQQDKTSKEQQIRSNLKSLLIL